MKVKKYFILLFFFLIKNSLNAIDVSSYKLVEPTPTYYYGNGLKTEILEKGYIFSSSKYKRSITSDLIHDERIYLCIDETAGKNRMVPITKLQLAFSENSLPDDILSLKNNTLIKKFIPSYFLTILEKQNKDEINTYHTVIAPFYENPKIYKEFNEDSNFFALITNIGIGMYNGDEIDFVEIKKISNIEYECECILFSGHENENYDDESFHWKPNIKTSTPIGQSEKVQIQIDGDYLELNNLTSNEHIDTLVCIDDSVIVELIKLFSTNKCDLSKVIWPHHADGSCDYEKGKTLVAASSSATNVSINKEMSVKENLKLRSAEATSSDALNIIVLVKNYMICCLQFVQI